MKKISVLFLLFIGLIVATSPINAEEVGYAIRAEKNEFQADQTVSYYDLKLQPEQKTTLVLAVINTSDEESTFHINATSARTSDGMALEYDPSDNKDKSLKIDFAKIAKVEEPTVTVKPKSEKLVSIEVKMPKEALKGTLLGSIHVIKAVDEEKKEQGGFYNQFAYAKPVVIHQGEVREGPDLKLKLVKVTSENSVYSVAGNIQNYRAALIKEVSAKTTVTKKGSQKVVLESEMSGGTIAPNSNFNLKLNFGKDDLENGTYTYHTTIKDNDGHEWTFNKDFKYEQKMLDEGGSLNFGGNNNNLLLFALGVLIILLLAFCIFLMVFLWKKKEDKNKKN